MDILDIQYTVLAFGSGFHLDKMTHLSYKDQPTESPIEATEKNKNEILSQMCFCTLKIVRISPRQYFCASVWSRRSLEVSRRHHPRYHLCGASCLTIQGDFSFLLTGISIIPSPLMHCIYHCTFFCKCPWHSCFSVDWDVECTQSSVVVCQSSFH